MSDIKKELEQELVKYSDEESKRIGTAIITAMRENASETGAKMLEIATARTEKVFLNDVINRVQELVQHRNNLFLAQEKLEREIALFNKRIAAVEKGEFSLARDGRLLYNDILLQY